MSKVLVWILVAVVVVGGGWYLLAGREGADGMMEGSETNSQEEGSAVSGEGTSEESLEGVLTRGGNYLCTFESTDPNSSSKGTVYMQDEQIRGDFESSVPAVGVVESHMIATGGYVYTWTSAAPTAGFKTKATAQTDLPNAISTSLGGSVEGDGYAASWNCRGWVPDASKFSLPSGVTFNELPQTR